MNVRSSISALSIRCSAGASGGISIGVNLNPDKVCNFDCIYCQVDRTRQSETRVCRDRRRCWPSWTRMLAAGRVGRDLCAREKFAGTPPAAAAAERHRLHRRRRADDVSQFRRDHRRLRGRQAAASAGRREDGADHQRQHVPPPARPARAGDSRREPGRNLGQARSRHRRVLPARRTHADSVPPDSRQHHGRRPNPPAGDSGPVHADRTASRRRPPSWTPFAIGSTKSPPPAAS